MVKNMTALQHLFSLILVSMLLFGAGSTIADTPSFYRAEVPVKNQSNAERGRAAISGLEVVLVRMSGSQDVVFNEAVRKRSKKALSYVTQFRYGALADEDLLDQGFSTYLILDFSPSMVKDILIQSGERYWQPNRARTLVWLVEDSAEHGKQLMNQSSAIELTNGLMEGAAVRGLPLAFPLLDLQDQFALSAEQLWALDEGSILEASARYGAELVLIGKYTQTSSGQLWSNWQFIHGAASKVFDRRSEDKKSAGLVAIEPLADYLASKYARKVNLQAEGFFSFKVEQVDTFGDYRGVMDFIASLDPVKNILIEQFVNNSLYLQVQSDANVEQLVGVVSLGGSLATAEPQSQNQLPAWQRESLGTPSNPLLYRWVGR